MLKIAQSGPAGGMANAVRDILLYAVAAGIICLFAAVVMFGY
jgi:hypothetical protein